MQGGEGRGSGHHSLSDGSHSSREYLSCPQKESQTIPNPVDTGKDSFPSAPQQCPVLTQHYQTPHIFPVNSQTKSIFSFTWRFKALGGDFCRDNSCGILIPARGYGMTLCISHLCCSFPSLFQPDVASNNFPTWSRSCYKVAASPIKTPAAAGFWERGCWRRASLWGIAFPCCFLPR